MALIRLGSIITDVRGRLAGHYIRSSSGPHVLSTVGATRQIPTEAQAETRASVQYITRTLWPALTQSQRDAWIDLAAANPTQTPWATTQPLQGEALFIRANQRAAAVGDAYFDDAPADQVVTALSALSCTATAPSTLTVTFAPSPVPADHYLKILSAFVVSPGQTNTSKRYRLTTTISAATSSPQNIGTAYNAEHGDLIATRKVFILAALYNRTNGAESARLYASAIVA